MKITFCVLLLIGSENYVCKDHEIRTNVEFQFVSLTELRALDLGLHPTFSMGSNGSLRSLNGLALEKRDYKSIFESLVEDKCHNIVINIRKETDIRLSEIVKVMSDFRAAAPSNKRFKVYFFCPSLLVKPIEGKNK